ncbi:MAG: PHP domain-containing protein [Bacillota bacterium]
MLADLHVHTTASDGTDSPEEVVGRAVSLGLGALAIADHDTVDGVEPALDEGRRKRLDVLPAVELGTEYGGREVHMLGYLVDIRSGELLDRLAFFRSGRQDRAVRMVDKLRKLGFPVTYQRVAEIAGYGSVGRVHIARAMIETGIVKSVDEAFELYIGEGKPGYEPRTKCTPSEAVRIIRDAGGVPVLAHPGLSRAGELIPDLLSQGLQGVEVYHPGHNQGLSQYYLQLCRRYGLVATGGSDYHGVESKKHNCLGAFTVHCRVVEEIRELARKNREKMVKEPRRTTGA